MHVYVTSPSGALDRADEISVTAELPGAGHSAIRHRDVPGRCQPRGGHDVNLPVAGLWTFEVAARYGEFDEVIFTVQIPVSD
jgi:hypothetical protein